MKSSLILVLAVSFRFSVATDNLVNWRSDDNVLPEMLPKNLREKSNEEIQNAVFDAYANQMKIVSEYSGHVCDPTYPFGYFKNEYFVPNTYTFQPDADLIFYNNVVRGLKDFSHNDIIIRWAPDQVETEVKWENTNIKGNYLYSNSTYFEQGKYHVQFENFKYMANTTLSENTMSYPSTIHKSSISYESIKVLFSGNLSEVINVNNSYHLKYFLENVAFQYVANGVAKSMHNNITIAIRQAVSPYIVFKNTSYPYFQDFTSNLPSGVPYKVDEIVSNGMNQTNLRINDVFVDMANKNVTAVTKFVIHKLNGNFTLHVDENKPFSGKAQFNINRINVVTAINMLNSAECTANVAVHNAEVKIHPESNLTSDVNQIIATEFTNSIVNRFNNTICSILTGMLKPEAGNY